MKQLSQHVMEYVKNLGAVSAGIATVETLRGGPESADITYVLPEAKSAICFALPLDQELIVSFLSKKDRFSHEHRFSQSVKH